MHKLERKWQDFPGCTEVGNEKFLAHSSQPIAGLVLGSSPQRTGPLSSADDASTCTIDSPPPAPSAAARSAQLGSGANNTSAASASAAEHAPFYPTTP